jgi:putative phosphotransacetylase
MSKKIVVETSARHIHVLREDLDKLFGKDYQLTIKKNLSQPGQYASEERVTLTGPKGELKMSILGPQRNATQVEVSYTDARTLGLNPPVRESGDIEGTPGVKVTGPAGSVELTKGVIVAKRHIHLTPDAAKEMGVKDKQLVGVRVGGERGVVFEQTVVRVSDKFAPAMHIDTDEANACGGQSEGEIIL